MEVGGVKPLVIETLMATILASQGVYFKPTTDELANEYSKAIEELTIIKGRASVTTDTMLATFNRQYLIMAGYSEGEVDGMGDLSYSSPQQVQELVKRRQGELLGLNGNHQKVVQMADVERLVADEGLRVSPPQ